MRNQLIEEKYKQLLVLVQKEKGVSDDIKTKMISLINDYANKNNPNELRQNIRMVSGHNKDKWTNKVMRFFSNGSKKNQGSKWISILSEEAKAEKLATVNNDSPAISLYLKMKPILKSLAKSTEQNCEEQQFQDTARLIR